VAPGDPNAADLAAHDEVVTLGTSDTAGVRLPPVGEPALDALVRMVAGQRMAVAWARATGQDPDARRGLSKVTTTR